MSPLPESFGRALALGLGLTVLLALGGAVLLERFSVAPAPATVPPPVEAPSAPEPRATVVEVVGRAERTRGTQWVALAEGDALAPEDAVRTAPGARVELQVEDDTSRLALLERSEARVGEVTAAVHTIRLERGRLDVDYRAREDRVLRVQSDGGAVAETRAARFTMLRRGGMVAVVTRDGSVGLTSAGVTVRVDAGRQSVAFDGASPLAAEPIPVEVLLKVASKAPPDGALCLSLSGQVRVGTEVRVEGEAAEVSREGTFQVEVLRPEGREQVRVTAREPGGAERVLSLACRPRERARPPPVESVKFRWKEAP